MIVLFTVMLLVLLATGLPVGFALGTGGLVGMLLFMGGDGTLNQIPLLAYKSLDDFVLCAVPLYVLMSQILLEMAAASARRFRRGDHRGLRYFCRYHRLIRSLCGYHRRHCHSGNAETEL